MKKSIGKNYIYNLVYQVFALVVPLITTPYVSRVLGAEGVGQYGFTYSLMSYFTLFAALGFAVYAQREIARCQGLKKEQSKVFWEIFLLRLVSTGISSGVNATLALTGIYGNYGILMLIWLVQIGSVALDITFFFQGNEEFSKIVLRNIGIKIVTAVLVFVLVRKPSDVWLYVLCIGGGVALGHVSLWLYMPRYLCKVSFRDLSFKPHILPVLRLFLPTIATSVYTVLDKTLIGVLIPDTYVVSETVMIDGVETVVQVVKKYSDLENGYYEQAERIVKIAMVAITSLGTVLIPRNSRLFAQGKTEEAKRNIYFATNFAFFFGIPIALGIAATAPNFVPWFLGNGFEKSVLLMQVLSPLVLIIGLSNVFGWQCLVALGADRRFTIAITAGAVINLLFNLLMIPFFWSLGAAIATIVAETSVTIAMAFMVRKIISIKRLLIQSVRPLIAGGVMFAVVYVTQMYFRCTILCSLLLVLEGIAVYILLIALLREPFLHLLISKLARALGALKRKKN